MERTEFPCIDVETSKEDSEEGRVRREEGN
jgi:hypothetical protein